MPRSRPERAPGRAGKRILAACLALATTLLVTEPACCQIEAAAPPAPAPQPAVSSPLDPDELERSGAVIGTIRFQILEVFDPSVPGENLGIYRLVNRLHVHTRQSTIRSHLLFSEGDPFVRERIEETERNLRALPFIQQASVVPESVTDGKVEVLVLTQDTWTTRIGGDLGSAGGKSTTGLSVSELNVLGRGKRLDLDLVGTQDRTTRRVRWEDLNVLDTRYQLSISNEKSSDGGGNHLRFELPFTSLETRRAWGIDAVQDQSTFSYYSEGEIVQKFDRRTTEMEAWVALSGGKREGVVARWTVSWRYADTAYDPIGSLPPGCEDSAAARRGAVSGPCPIDPIPATRTSSGPALTFTWIRPDFIKVRYFERFARVEDYNVGTRLDLRTQISPRAFGGTVNEVLYDYRISQGLRTGPHGVLLGDAWLRGRAGALEQGAISFEGKHYTTGWPNQTFVVRLAGDYGVHIDATNRFLLGGDEGLRGFRARRFSGDRRFVLNVEDRIRLNRMLLHLAQVGAAVFVDVGNAWGGTRVVETCGEDAMGDPVCRSEVEENRFGRLKADVGVGLLLDVVRASHASFIRLNLAYPIDGERYGQARVLFSYGRSGF